MPERINRTWTVGPYRVSEIEEHSFREFEGQPLYAVTVEPETKMDSERYLSLDHALAAGIARRWTGPRMAGGSGVGTAADWFMVMIGARDAGTIPERRDEIEERKRAELRQEIAERTRRDLLRRAAANPVKLVRGSDDLLG